MGDITKIISASELNVLLPICTESKNDVFMNILKNVVGHLKLGDHYLECAFKSCMHGGELAIEQEDVEVNWTQLNSRQQQIRQAQLLGFWAINGFPSLGKKLFGASYLAPNRSSVEVIGSSVMSAESIDDFIIPKMKLLLIKLNVKGSTVMKMQYFVKIPAFVGEENGLQISRKMKSFEIKTEFLETCWQALKYGEFPKNLDPAGSLDNHRLKIQHEAHTSNPCVASTIDETTSYNDFPTIPSSKRACPSRDRVGSTNMEDFPTIPSSKRACPSRDPLGSTNMEGSLRDIVLEMRNDIAHLTKASNSERLHIMIVKQKDEEIAQTKASTQQLKEDLGRKLAEAEREIMEWKHRSSAKDEEIVLTEAMAQGFKQVNEDLCEKLAEAERVMTEWKGYALGKDEEIALTKASAHELKQANEDLVLKLASAERSITEWKCYATRKEEELVERRSYAARKDEEVVIANNSQKILQDDLAALKNKSTSIVIEMQGHIKSLENNLSAAGGVNLDLNKRKNELGQELNVVKGYLASKDEELVALKNISGSNVVGETNVGILTGDQSADSVSTGTMSTDSTPTENVSNGNMLENHEILETHDQNLLEIRNHLKSLRFGWMKFHQQKNAKFIPGFVHPPEPDGEIRAQWVVANGPYFVSSSKKICFEFHETINETLKEKRETIALNKFNRKFNFCYS